MNLDEQDKAWIGELVAGLRTGLERVEKGFRTELERVETGFRTELERVATALLTEFHKWAAPNDQKLRTHREALRALDVH
jgi:hypothetical protein